MEHLTIPPTASIFDLILLILGFLGGWATRFRTPLLFTMFLVRLVKWWFETHPQGKKAAKETNFDEELTKIEAKLGLVDSK